MMQIPIQQLPNQSFSTLLDGNQWDFLLKTAGDITVISLVLNGTDIINSVKAQPGALIIPYQYLESGNFFFVTQGFQIPFYTEFNVSQSLIYISAAELAAIRAQANPVPITVASFNPIAALPLRFSPKGYVGA